MTRSNSLLRPISLILLQSFIFQQISFAEVLTPLKENLFEKPMVNLSIPESVATIEDAWLSEDRGQRTENRGQTNNVIARSEATKQSHSSQIASSPLASRNDKLIYLIQDAHTNESGQLNLSKALDLLLTQDKGVKYVFTEAGVNDNSLSFLRPFRPLKERQALSLSYLKQGLLHGTEYLDLTSDHSFTLWGVESPDLYIKSLEDYKAVAKDRERFDLYLKKIDSTLNTLKPRFFNPSLLQFDQDLNKFEKEDITLTQFFQVLLREATLQNINLTPYPHLKNLEQLKAKEEAINFQKANEEQVKALSSLSPKDQEELKDLTESQSAKGGSASGGNSPFKLGKSASKDKKAFYTLLEEKLTPKAMKQYPNLLKYLDYLKIAKQIEAKHVLLEVKALKDQVLTTLSKTDDEKTLIKCQIVLRHLEKLFHLTLTPEEFKEYKDLSLNFKLEHLTGFLNKKIMDLGTYYERSLFLEKGYEDMVKRSEDFYALTLERDQYFVSQMLNKMTLESQSKAVLVTGGFHTTDLKALLKDKGISFISITPQVLKETNMKRYENILLNQKMETSSTHPTSTQTPMHMGTATAITGQIPVFQGARLALEGIASEAGKEALGARLASANRASEIAELTAVKPTGSRMAGSMDRRSFLLGSAAGFVTAAVAGGGYQWLSNGQNSRIPEEREAAADLPHKEVSNEVPQAIQEANKKLETLKKTVESQRAQFHLRINTAGQITGIDLPDALKNLGGVYITVHQGSPITSEGVVHAAVGDAVGQQLYFYRHISGADNTISVTIHVYKITKEGAAELDVLSFTVVVPNGLGISNDEAGLKRPLDIDGNGKVGARLAVDARAISNRANEVAHVLPNFYNLSPDERIIAFQPYANLLKSFSQTYIAFFVKGTPDRARNDLDEGNPLREKILKDPVNFVIGRMQSSTTLVIDASIDRIAFVNMFKIIFPNITGDLTSSPDHASDDTDFWNANLMDRLLEEANFVAGLSIKGNKIEFLLNYGDLTTVIANEKGNLSTTNDEDIDPLDNITAYQDAIQNLRTIIGIVTRTGLVSPATSDFRYDRPGFHQAEKSAHLEQLNRVKDSLQRTFNFAQRNLEEIGARLADSDGLIVSVSNASISGYASRVAAWDLLAALERDPALRLSQEQLTDIFKEFQNTQLSRVHRNTIMLVIGQALKNNPNLVLTEPQCDALVDFFNVDRHIEEDVDLPKESHVISNAIMNNPEQLDFFLKKLIGKDLFESARREIAAAVRDVSYRPNGPNPPLVLTDQQLQLLDQARNSQKTDKVNVANKTIGTIIDYANARRATMGARLADLSIDEIQIRNMLGDAFGEDVKFSKIQMGRVLGTTDENNLSQSATRNERLVHKLIRLGIVIRALDGEFSRYQIVPDLDNLVSLIPANFYREPDFQQRIGSHQYKDTNRWWLYVMAPSSSDPTRKLEGVLTSYNSSTKQIVLKTATGKEHSIENFDSGDPSVKFLSCSFEEPLAAERAAKLITIKIKVEEAIAKGARFGIAEVITTAAQIRIAYRENNARIIPANNVRQYENYKKSRFDVPLAAVTSIEYVRTQGDGQKAFEAVDFPAKIKSRARMVNLAVRHLDAKTEVHLFVDTAVTNGARLSETLSDIAQEIDAYTRSFDTFLGERHPSHLEILTYMDQRQGREKALNLMPRALRAIQDVDRRQGINAIISGTLVLTKPREGRGVESLKLILARDRDSYAALSFEGNSITPIFARASEMNLGMQSNEVFYLPLAKLRGLANQEKALANKDTNGARLAEMDKKEVAAQREKAERVLTYENRFDKLSRGQIFDLEKILRSTRGDMSIGTYDRIRVILEFYDGLQLPEFSALRHDDIVERAKALYGRDDVKYKAGFDQAVNTIGPVNGKYLTPGLADYTLRKISNTIAKNNKKGPAGARMAAPDEVVTSNRACKVADDLRALPDFDSLTPLERMAKFGPYKADLAMLSEEYFKFMEGNKPGAVRGLPAANALRKILRDPVAHIVNMNAQKWGSQVDPSILQNMFKHIFPNSTGDITAVPENLSVDVNYWLGNHLPALLIEAESVVGLSVDADRIEFPLTGHEMVAADNHGNLLDPSEYYEELNPLERTQDFQAAIIKLTAFIDMAIRVGTRPLVTSHPDSDTVVERGEQLFRFIHTIQSLRTTLKAATTILGARLVASALPDVLKDRIRVDVGSALVPVETLKEAAIETPPVAFGDENSQRSVTVFFKESGRRVLPGVSADLPLADASLHVKIYSLIRKNGTMLVVVDKITQKQLYALDLSTQARTAIHDGKAYDLTNAKDLTDDIFKVRDANRTPAVPIKQAVIRVIFIDDFQDLEGNAFWQSVAAHFGPILSEGDQVVFLSPDLAKAQKIADLVKKFATQNKASFTASTEREIKALMAKEMPISFLGSESGAAAAMQAYGNQIPFFSLEEPDKGMAAAYALTPIAVLMGLVSVGDWSRAAERYNQITKGELNGASLQTLFLKNHTLVMPYILQAISSRIAQILMAERAFDSAA